VTAERGDAIGIRFLGHATVLLDLPGVRILTDPVLRHRLGPLRRHGPLPRPDELGPIDVVLVSHAHPDHFDRRSLEALIGRPVVVVPRGLGGAVRQAGHTARELASGEAFELSNGWSIAAVPARHWRWPLRPGAPTIGYLIEASGQPGIYFAGDTALFAGMARFAERVDIALLPIASWGPHLAPGHLGPRTAAIAARDLAVRHVIPIHWGTLYPSGLHRILGGRLREPPVRFEAWAGQLAPSVDVRILAPGEATEIEVGGGGFGSSRVGEAVR
jgi:L-ascorbate metabolism protein UlaG (beta-lactamase superfamily)